MKELVNSGGNAADHRLGFDQIYESCVIDGFLVSPNVEVLSVATSDLEFENSDHNPVRLEVRARAYGSAPR